MSILPILNLKQFPTESEEGFYANDFISHVKAHHHFITKPHKHDFYLTVLFTQGLGIHEIDFQSYEIKQGSIFMLNPGQTHYWEFSADTNGYVIFHTKAFYDLVFTHKNIDNFPFFYSLQNAPYLYIDQVELRQIEQWFEIILSEYRADKALKYRKIISLLDVLYIQMTRLYLQKNEPRFNNTPPQYLYRIRQLEHFIDENYLKYRTARNYADMMNMSTRHLNRITQTLLGKTTSDLIAERVLLEAQRMLSHTEVSVAEVADFLGFEDHAYFSRFFKKNLKTTPSEFASKYR